MELNTMKLIDWPLLFLLFGARDFNRTGNTKGPHFRPDYIDMFLIPRLSNFEPRLLHLVLLPVRRHFMFFNRKASERLKR